MRHPLLGTAPLFDAAHSLVLAIYLRANMLLVMKPVCQSTESHLLLLDTCPLVICTVDVLSKVIVLRGELVYLGLEV